MVSVTVKYSSRPTVSIDFPAKHPNQVTVADLKKAIHAKFPKLTPVRQRITIPSPSASKDPKAKPTVLDVDVSSLATYGVPDSGAELRVKDLGPQVSWRTVFLLEYFGPLFIQPLIYYMSYKHGYSLASVLNAVGINALGKAAPYTPSALQKTVLTLQMLHYLKRELETIFVHKFSHATMPFRNIFKNCGHYWLLCGVSTAVTLYRPAYSASALRGTVFDDFNWIGMWTAAWVWAECSNLLTHLNLRNIRTPPGQPRKFPKGYGFDYVTCANYLFESCAWVAISIMTCDPAMILFTAVSAGQMAEWAAKKHRVYKKEHGDKYPKNRKRMIPFIY
ncbi:3-oxo-5a-steroid 4- dehydrogenase [Naganishia albida]|nr:3-oxo-5a-steroid 4- dehydrogenase [Naganishia albida]